MFSFLQSDQTTSDSPEYALAFLLPYLWVSMSPLFCYSEILPVLQHAGSSVALRPDSFVFKPSNHFIRTTLWHLHSITFYKDTCTCLFPTDLKFPENKIISNNFVFPTAPTKISACTRQQGALSCIQPQLLQLEFHKKHILYF